MKTILKKITLVLVLSIAANAIIAKDFYVSPNGNNKNRGTKDAPFATIQKAKKAVRNLIARGVNEDINVYLFGGEYNVPKTLVFGLKDSNGSHKVTWQAVNGEEPVISSGVGISFSICRHYYFLANLLQEYRNMIYPV